MIGKPKRNKTPKVEDVFSEPVNDTTEKKESPIVDFTDTTDPEKDIAEAKPQPSKPIEEKKTVDFFGNDFSSEILKEETVRKEETGSKAELPEGLLSDSEKSDLKAQHEKELEKEKEASSKILEFEDCLDFAEVGIETLDSVCGELCKWISDEKTSAKFELPVKKKKNLSYMLARILVKHQIRLSIEVLFAVSIVIAFGTNIRYAFKLRSDKKKTPINEASENGKSKEYKSSINTKA